MEHETLTERYYSPRIQIMNAMTRDMLCQSKAFNQSDGIENNSFDKDPFEW